jgi:UDP-glucose 4-epimerase
LKGEKIPVQFRDWRPGDQPCYISDIRKAANVMGWKPLIDRETGIRRLWEWVASNPEIFGAAVAEALPAMRRNGAALSA